MTTAIRRSAAPDRWPEQVRHRTITMTVSLGLTLVIAAAVLQRRHSADHWPFDPWGFDQQLQMVLTTAGTGTSVLVGGWLWWRLPRNPTGCWIIACGSAHALLIIGENWPHQFGVWCAALAPIAAKVAIVLAVVRWPTARLDQRARKPFTVVLAAYIAICTVTQLLGTSLSRWADPSLVLPTATNVISGSLVLVTSAFITRAIAPAMMLAVMARRAASLPVEMRRESRPVVAAVAVLALSELWIFVTDGLLAPLGASGERPEAIFAIRDAMDGTRFGVIALLLVSSEAMRRRRALAHDSSAGFIELGSLSWSARPGAEIARVLGDSTAELQDTNADIASAQVGQAAIAVLDPENRQLATVTHDAKLEVTAATRAALTTTLELTLARRARRVEADRATSDLRAMQRTLLDAQDHARRALERDLHDAVQQRLVALTLQASLLARREGTSGRCTELRSNLLDSIDESIQLVHQVVESGTPAALSSGLAAGLKVLAASSPLPTELDAVGDLASKDPTATHLWFIAADAVANALKHAHPTRLWLLLLVDDHGAELSVMDDGVGGMQSVPTSIQLRSDAIGAHATTGKSPYGGTTIRVNVAFDTPVDR